MNAIFKAFLILASFLSCQAHATDPDIPRTCEDQGTLDTVNIKSDNICDFNTPGWDVVMTKGSTDDILKMIRQHCTSGYHPGSLTWELLASPRLEVRMAALIWQESLADSLATSLNSSIPTSARDVLEKAAQKPAQYSSAVKALVNRIFFWAKGTDLNSRLDQAELISGLLCLPYKSDDCANALVDALKMSHVKMVDDAAVTSVDQVKTLLTDPRFTQGLSIAALRILDLIQKSEQGHIPTTHLIDDLVSSFSSTGVSNTSALDMSFTFLSFYGTRGASMAMVNSLVNSENQAIMLASETIAAGIGALDIYTLSTGHPYSLPAEISTSCNYGSPYHFWMPAALAWQLVKMSHDPWSATISAHILGVGYETFGDLHGRASPWVVMTVPAKSLSNNFIRVEIAMNDAGARYGAERAAGMKNSTCDVDNRISQLINAAPDSPPLSTQAAVDLWAKTLSYNQAWQKLFVPDVGLNSF